MEDWFLVHHYATRMTLTRLWKSIYGAAAEGSREREVSAAEGSQEREVSAQADEPMENPYEQPSRRGRSQEREEPQDVWEQQRSSSGSPESPQHDDPQQDAQDNQQEEPSVDVHDDPMGEEAVNLWEAEDPPDDIEDPVVEQATKSSISASNRIPGSCMRQELSVQEKRAVNSSRTPQEKK